jgi:uncharacterized membrane protein YgcG
MTEQSRLRRDGALAGRIADYAFDKAGAAFPFSLRLAQENGWTHAFALRAIDEYRRFAYLACIAGEELTPSDEVDQVWHLHLAYSRDYWEDFCPNVLKRPFHHGPTDGGSEEDARYGANYIRTLQHYAAVFGEAPPLDIWPPPEVRFSLADKCTRVNRALFNVTPRTDLPHRPVIAARNFVRPLILVLVFGALLALFTSRAGQGTDLRDHLLWAGLGTVGYYIIGRIVAAVLKVLDASREALRPESFRQELHGSEVIYAVRDGRTIVSRVKQKPEPSSRKHQQGGGGGCGAGCSSGCGGGGCGGGG